MATKTGASLSDRHRRVLEVLAEEDRPIGSGRVWILAFGADEPYRGRRDAGMTRTLDAMRRAGLVRDHHVRGWQQPTRDWSITPLGREALHGH